MEPLFTVTALYTYDARTAEEISFHENAFLRVYERVDADWWWAKFDNEIGLIPSNYVLRNPDPESEGAPAPPLAAQVYHIDPTPTSATTPPGAGAVDSPAGDAAAAAAAAATPTSPVQAPASPTLQSGSESADDYSPGRRTSAPEEQKHKLLSALDGLGFPNPVKTQPTLTYYGPDGLRYISVWVDRKRKRRGSFGVSRPEAMLFLVEDGGHELISSWPLGEVRLEVSKKKRLTLTLLRTGEVLEYERDRDDIQLLVEDFLAAQVGDCGLLTVGSSLAPSRILLAS